MQKIVIMLILILISSCLSNHNRLNIIDLAPISEIDEIISKKYVKRIDHNELTKGAITGIFSKLDEYSDFFSDEDYRQFMTNISNNIVGIGIEFFKHPDGIQVISAIDNSPAARAGIKTGDVITHINDKEIEMLSLTKVGLMLQGQPGTGVQLTLKDEKTLDQRIILVKRERISIQTAKLIKSGKIPIIKISIFDEKTLPQLQKILLDLKKSNPIGLIFDLRNNPGGLLDSAINITSIFLKDRPIVLTVFKDKQIMLNPKSSYFDKYYEKKPIAIMVNNGSASGSEIFTSAMVENKRAIAVGTKTFGKGLVQDIIPLDTIPNHAIKITVAKYYSINNVSIDKIGITPDVICDESSQNDKNCNIINTAERVILSYY